MSFIKTYGEPGGIFLGYTLDFDRAEYIVYNEAGDELYASSNEQDAIDFCEETIVIESAQAMA